MTIGHLNEEAPPDDGEVVVRITGVPDPDALARCLQSVLTHTDQQSARMLVVDEDGERLAREALRDAGSPDRDVLWARPAEAARIVTDTVLLRGDEVVAPGWIEALRVAAQDDARIASVSAIDDPDGSAELPAPSPRCAWLSRGALALVGPPAAGQWDATALEAFGARCLAHGLRHVGVDLTPAAGDGLSVTIDGRCLSTSVTGTAVAVLELAAGLCAHGGVDVRVLVLDGLPAAARALVEGAGARAVTIAEAERTGPSDIAHRPYQLGVADDLRVLRRVGRRIVVTHLDSIAYRTAAYFSDDAQWRRFRELARVALTAADAIVFLSEDAASDARALGLGGEGRAAVIPLAVDDPLAGGRAPECPPSQAARLQERPYLLCLGADFAHKNRPFAIRLLDALLDADLFDGTLVLAGPHVDVGSSAAEEASLLRARPALRERVLDLGAVAEGEKRWLLRHGAAVVYPTTFEGFGLIPFEAARADVPALFAWTSSLRELFAPELGLLVAWDAGQSAQRVAPVLASGAARQAQVRAVAQAGASLTTERNARRHLELYRTLIADPPRRAAADAMRALELQDERGRLAGELQRTQARLATLHEDPLIAGFVGPGALVPDELRRASLAVAARPLLRNLIVMAYRAARWVARRAG